MNLANRITLLRILLIPVILVFLLPVPVQGFDAWNSFILARGRIIALVLFALAALTDLFDGAIARRRGMVTNLGKFLDPIADKMLVVSVLIALVQLSRIHAVPVIMIIFRELMVTGIRLLAAGKGVVIAAGNLGKIKTVLQLIAILMMLAEPLASLLFTDETLLSWQTMPANVVMAAAVVFTIWSGLDYLVRNRKYLSD